MDAFLLTKFITIRWFPQALLNISEEWEHRAVTNCLMSSPTIDTFCCVIDSSGVGLDTKLQFRVHSYTMVCIVSSVFSIFGALYQLLPRPPRFQGPKRMRYSADGQRKILHWLAIADLMAAMGILVRSVYWLCRVYDEEANNNGGVFCAVVSGWIQYFYTATYMWSLCYAVDVYMVLSQKGGKQLHYHVVSWGVPAVTACIGLYVLYKPDLNCRHDIAHVLPNYLCTHIPLLVVMIASPTLYSFSSGYVVDVMTQRYGQYTQNERVLATALKGKFFDIVLVFYVCWMPNIINSLILWSMWYELESVRNVVIAVWYVMAILNPLQAVLNSLVYRSWEGEGGALSLLKNLCVCWERKRNQPPPIAAAVSKDSESSEHTPLIVNGSHFYGVGVAGPSQHCK